MVKDSKNDVERKNGMGKQEDAARARALFYEGYNCAQSVFVAFADRMGLEREKAAQMASSFGAGMGRLREVCGAVSAMFLIAGMACGYADPKDDEAKAAHYQRIQQLAAQFRQRHGTIICRELLGLPEGPDDYVPSKRTEAYYENRPCAQCIADAAEIISAFLDAQGIAP